MQTGCGSQNREWLHVVINAEALKPASHLTIALSPGVDVLFTTVSMCPLEMEGCKHTSSYRKYNNTK